MTWLGSSWKKSSGNPFFAGEILRTLHEGGRLRFSSEERAFTWDVREIDDVDLTPNVVELVLRKLERLPEATLSLVRYAAAAGNRFDLGLLAAVAGVTPRAARARLAPAIRERLVVPLDPSYPMGLVDVSAMATTERDDYAFRFLHDRVQQAAYESLDGAARPSLHLRLGRILSARPRAEDGEWLFDVVVQMNRGAALIVDGGERLELARLNLDAGDRARRTTAYDEAREYLGQGIALLPADAWSCEYELAAALHQRYAEATYLCGPIGRGRRFLRRAAAEAPHAPREGRALRHSHRGRDFARPVRACPRAFTRGSRNAGTSSAAPGHDGGARVARACARGDWRPAHRGPRSAAGAHGRAPPRRRENSDHSYVPAYFGDPAYLFVWVVHENIRLAIEHGVTAEAAAAFTNYGVYLIARERDYDGALAFGRLAMALVERDDAFALRCQVYETTAGTSHAYAVNHLRTCIPLLKGSSSSGWRAARSCSRAWAPRSCPTCCSWSVSTSTRCAAKQSGASARSALFCSRR